jgi:TRAP-type transport system periplasmic protein
MFCLLFILIIEFDYVRRTIMKSSRLPALLVSLVLVVIFVSLSFLTGCSGTAITSAAPTTKAPAATTAAPPPAQTIAPVPASSSATASKPAASSPAPTSPLAAAAPVYNLKFVDMYTPGAKDAITNESLGSLITKNTGGKVGITYFHNTLGKPADFLNLLNGGACDIANLTPGETPNQFGMEMGLELPGLGFPDRASRIDVMWQLLDKGYFTGFANYKVLAFNPTPAMNFYFVKSVKTVADMKGLRIRASAQQMLDVIKNVGAVPTPISTPDVYMSLSRGVLDGVYTAYEQILQMKFYEVSKYYVTNPVNQGCMYIIMNKKVWDGMPADVQTGINQAIKDYQAAYLTQVAEPDKTWVQALQQNGMTGSTFSDADVALIVKAAADAKTAFVKDQGQKGSDMLDAAAKLIKK